MRTTLREYLESLGLEPGATTRGAWDFYRGLDGDERRRADALKTGAPGDPAAEPANNRSATAVADAPVGGGGAPLPGHDAAPAGKAGDDVAVTAERQRVTTIRQMARENDIPQMMFDRAIDESWTTERTAREFLTHVRRELGAPMNDRHGDAPAGFAHAREENCTTRALGMALAMRAGVNPVDPAASDERRRGQERLADQANEFASLSLVDFCREALRIEGLRVPRDQGETIRAAASTAALQSIFTDSVNAIISQSFADAPDTTRAWTEEGQVADFKQGTDITLSKTSGMRKLARGGQAQDAEISDAAETFKIARYASKFTLDEQDIIDDSHNALDQLASEMRDDAAQLRPRLVYSLLLANPTLNADSTAVFAAGHNNNATAALADASLQTAIAAMAKQTNGARNLNIAARFLIVPQDLRFTGLKLLNSAEIRNPAASAGYGTANVLSGLNLTLIADNYIGAAGVVDPDSGTKYTGSATNWFIAGGRRTVRVLYRRGGGTTPRVRSYQLNRGQYGVGFDVSLDIGAYIRDYRALYKSAGTA